MKKLIAILFVLALGVVLTGRAYAATEAATLDVSANVIASCTVATTRVAFPQSDGSTAVPGTGDVTVNCTIGSPYNIALDAGLNYNMKGASSRNITDGAANYVSYALYQDAANTIGWGDGSSKSLGASLADTGTGADQPHVVYGLLSASSIVPGAYSDTVNVTVYY